ncbi:4Fe-4S dicluster domain-containing protein [bacterium]|nr:4Fe-4S dicluster domain-containing protein [candidate division CSSED10-310 bacterium]
MAKRILGFLKPNIELQPWDGEVSTLDPPDRVILSISQPGQMPFKPVVEIGESVKTGEFIAMSPSRTGIHSSITGKVSAIGPGYNREGREVLCVTIDRESDDDFAAPHPVQNLVAASRDELIEAFAELGFASPWKPRSLESQLSEEEKLPITTVVIKAVDEEPPLAVQRRFLTEFAEDFSESVAAIRKLAQDARVVVVVPEEFASRARTLLKDVEIFPVTNDILDCNNTLLLLKITRKFYPFHTDPRADGIIILSAEDVAFAARCLHKGKPRTNKLITVSAPDLPKPVTVRVRLGTPVRFVLDSLNIQLKSNDRVVFGGLLTGIAQPDIETPITRTTNGVIIIPKEKVIPFSDAPCINCGRCVQICPVNIQVNLVGRFSEFGLFETAVKNGSGSCVECGLCAYVCPSRRPLMQYMQFANSEFEKIMNQVSQEGV